MNKDNEQVKAATDFRNNIENNWGRIAKTPQLSLTNAQLKSAAIKYCELAGLEIHNIPRIMINIEEFNIMLISIEYGRNQ